MPLTIYYWQHSKYWTSWIIEVQAYAKYDNKVRETGNRRHSRKSIRQSDGFEEVYSSESYGDRSVGVAFQELHEPVTAHGNGSMAWKIRLVTAPRRSFQMTFVLAAFPEQVFISSGGGPERYESLLMKLLESDPRGPNMWPYILSKSSKVSKFQISLDRFQ